MPIFVFLLPFALFIVLLPVLLPLSLVQRYRVGTRRQPARGWLMAINLIALMLSASMLLMSAGVANLWVDGALLMTVAGLATGGLLGLLGLAITRWQPSGRQLHFQPNRWLVLTIMLVVLGRLLYGLWRGWSLWGSTADATTWLAESGAAGSLAAGGLVIGYYLSYWSGVRRRLRRHRITIAPTGQPG